MKNIPESAINTLINSLSTSTIAQYGTTYKQWWQFCQLENISPYYARISSVIKFLQNILDEGEHSYATFNAHRSALSLILQKELGTNAILKRFMKGVSKLKPPKAKYEYTWDPQLVLNYLENIPTVSLEILSKKLVTLLCLTTGQRLQTIHCIRLSYIQISDEGIQIFIPDVIKTSGINKKQPCLNLPFFKENSKICVATTLIEYIDLTKDLRPNADDRLFITFKKPHKHASKQTLSRWVKNILETSGIDTNIFKAHSTRHAASSSAFKQGVPLEEIYRSAGWTQTSNTFARFYNRPITNKGSFAISILNLRK